MVKEESILPQEEHVFRELKEAFGHIENVRDKVEDDALKYGLTHAMNKIQMAMHFVQADIDEIHKIRDMAREWVTSAEHFEKLFQRTVG